MCNLLYFCSTVHQRQQLKLNVCRHHHLTLTPLRVHPHPTNFGVCSFETTRTFSTARTSFVAVSICCVAHHLCLPQYQVQHPCSSLPPCPTFKLIQYLLQQFSFLGRILVGFIHPFVLRRVLFQCTQSNLIRS